jgi:hypothetical protein
MVISTLQQGPGVLAALPAGRPPPPIRGRPPLLPAPPPTPFVAQYEGVRPGGGQLVSSKYSARIKSPLTGVKGSFKVGLKWGYRGA